MTFLDSFFSLFNYALSIKVFQGKTVMLGLMSLICFMSTFSMSNIHSFSCYNGKVISDYFFIISILFVQGVQLAVLVKIFKVTFKEIFGINATSRSFKSRIVVKSKCFNVCMILNMAITSYYNPHKLQVEILVFIQSGF